MFTHLSSLLQSFNTPYESRSSKSYSGRISKRKSNVECFDFIALIQQWPEIIGPKMANYTIPLKNTYQTLTILTSHNVFANELSFMEEIIKKKIFTIFPTLRSSIKRIKFQISNEHFNQNKKILQGHYQSTTTTTTKEKVHPCPHPYSIQYRQINEKAQLMFQDLQDSELKKILTSLLIQKECGDNNKSSR